MELDAIRKRIDQIEELQEEIKIGKDMLKGELENELAYLETVEEVKAAVQKRKQIKEEILAKGPNQEMVASIKNNQEELTTLRDILSAELTEIFKKNDTDRIDDRKFVVSAKLLPKKANFDKRDFAGKYASEE